jgi:hypothetical protein
VYKSSQFVELTIKLENEKFLNKNSKLLPSTPKAFSLTTVLKEIASSKKL